MGEARRRKLAGDTKPKGNDYRKSKPSKHMKWLSESYGINRLYRRSKKPAR